MDAPHLPSEGCNCDASDLAPSQSRAVTEGNINPDSNATENVINRSHVRSVRSLLNIFENKQNPAVPHSECHENKNRAAVSAPLRNLRPQRCGGNDTLNAKALINRFTKTVLRDQNANPRDADQIGTPPVSADTFVEFSSPQIQSQKVVQVDRNPTGLDSRVEEILSEAQATAQRAVRSDEQEQYVLALESYLLAIELYRKVVALLTLEEQLDIQSAIAMYRRRCKVIHSAYTDDDDYETGRASEPADNDIHPQAPPDYRTKPTTIPDATQLPDSDSQAYRNFLRRSSARRISKTATPSMTREQMNDIKEKLDLTKHIFLNFVVKHKDLGQARAVEMALSDLNAKIFGDYKHLRPLSAENIREWKSHVEVINGMLEKIEDERSFLRKRADIANHLPNLKKCDDLIIETMSNFTNIGKEVEYVDNDSKSGSKSWWVKVPVVRKGGLSRNVRNMLDDVRRDLKSAHKSTHAINMDVLKSMKVPPGYVDTLPRHSRQIIPKDLKERLMSRKMFKISDYMKDAGIWNKDKAAEFCTALENVELVWRARMERYNIKSIFSRTFSSLNKGRERGSKIINALHKCQDAIRELRREFTTMNQTELDTQKVANCEDIGLAGLEAYSRALESRAHIVLSRVLDVLRADDKEKQISVPMI